ncbi:helix-hairpin-helix domain-containing protein [Halosimplex marinum]|uniref:helix-hairpin-helix domain-containing protein n=1 Tax=Halosimplex marinum TaxID=3396620 RepID=UPI003F5539BF
MSDQFTEIKYVGEHRADVLSQAGYTSLEELSQATKQEVASVDGLDEAIAERIVHHFEKER